MGLEILTIISIAITVITTAISFLLKPGDPGFEGEAETYALSDRGSSIPVAYGRTRVPGLVAFADEQPTQDRPSSWRDAINAYPIGNLDDDLRTKKRREFQMSQHVFTVTNGVESIQKVRVDNRSEEDEDKWKVFKAKIGTPGQVEQTIVDFTPDRDSNARFTDLQYLTAICHQTPRENPQWYGYPRFLAYGLWEKTRHIIRTGVAPNYQYSLSATRSYSPNVIRCMLDYILDSKYGIGRPFSSMDAKWWYDAQEYYGTIVQGAGNVLWDQDYPDVCNMVFGTNYDKWSDAFNAVGLMNKNDVGLGGDGSMVMKSQTVNPFTGVNYNTAGGRASFEGEEYWTSLPTHLLRAEFHGVIDTRRRYRDNLNRFLEVIPWTFVFEDHNGLLTIRFPRSDMPAMDQSAFRVNKDNILIDGGLAESTPDAEKRPNQLVLEFDSAANGMEKEVEVFPPDGSTFHNSLLAQDHGRHHRAAFVISGTNNIFHAHTLCAIYLLTGRRQVWQSVLNATGGLIEMGDVGTLVDELNGITKFVRVIDRRVNYRLRQVILALMEFEPCDYLHLPHAAELSAPKVIIPTISSPENVNLAIPDGEERILQTTWDDPASEVGELIIAFDVEISNDDGSTWENVGRIEADAENVVNYRSFDRGKTYKSRVRSVSQNLVFSEWVESNELETTDWVIVDEPLAEEARTLLDYIPVMAPGVHAAVNRDGEWSLEKTADRTVALDRTDFTDVVTGSEWPQYLWGIFGASTDNLRNFLRKIKSGTQMLIKFDDNNFALYYIFASNAQGGLVENDTAFTNWQWVGEKVEFNSKGKMGELILGSDVTIGVNAYGVKKDQVYAMAKSIVKPGRNVLVNPNDAEDTLTVEIDGDVGGGGGGAVIDQPMDQVIQIGFGVKKIFEADVPVANDGSLLTVEATADIWANVSGFFSISIGGSSRTFPIPVKTQENDFETKTYTHSRPVDSGTTRVQIFAYTTPNAPSSGRGGVRNLQVATRITQRIVVDDRTPEVPDISELVVSLPDVNPDRGDLITASIAGGITPYSAQWKRRRPDNTRARDIAGATNIDGDKSRYRPTGQDLGQELGITVRDSSVPPQEVTSWINREVKDFFSVVINNGEDRPVVGTELECIPTGGSGNFTFRWVRVRSAFVRATSGFLAPRQQDIPGATGRFYTPTVDDIGFYLYCYVISGGVERRASSRRTVIAESVDDLSVTLSDTTPTWGQTIRARAVGGAGAGTYQYKWYHTLGSPFFSKDFIQDDSPLLSNGGMDITLPRDRNGMPGRWGGFLGCEVFSGGLKADTWLSASRILPGVGNPPLSARIYPQDPIAGHHAYVYIEGGGDNPSIQWLLDGMNITGEIREDILLLESQRDKRLSCRVTSGTDVVVATTSSNIRGFLGSELQIVLETTTPVSGSVLRATISGGQTGTYKVEWQRFMDGSWETITEEELEHFEGSAISYSPHLHSGEIYRSCVTDDEEFKCSEQTHEVPHTPLSVSVSIQGLTYPSGVKIIPYPGMTVRGTSSGGSGAELARRWYFDGEVIPGATQTTLLVTENYLDGFLTYEAEKRNVGGSNLPNEVADATFEFPVEAPPEIEVDLPPLPHYRKDMILFPVLSGGIFSYSAAWDLGGFHVSDDLYKDLENGVGESPNLVITSGFKSKRFESPLFIQSTEFLRMEFPQYEMGENARIAFDQNSLTIPNQSSAQRRANLMAFFMIDERTGRPEAQPFYTANRNSSNFSNFSVIGTGDGLSQQPVERRYDLLGRRFIARFYQSGTWSATGGWGNNNGNSVQRNDDGFRIHSAFNHGTRQPRLYSFSAAPLFETPISDPCVAKGTLSLVARFQSGGVAVLADSYYRVGSQNVTPSFIAEHYQGNVHFQIQRRHPLSEAWESVTDFNMTLTGRDSSRQRQAIYTLPRSFGRVPDELLGYYIRCCVRDDAETVYTPESARVVGGHSGYTGFFSTQNPVVGEPLKFYGFSYGSTNSNPFIRWYAFPDANAPRFFGSNQRQFVNAFQGIYIPTQEDLNLYIGINFNNKNFICPNRVVNSL